jgi:hypothetical protein
MKSKTCLTQIGGLLAGPSIEIGMECFMEKCVYCGDGTNLSIHIVPVCSECDDMGNKPTEFTMSAVGKADKLLEPVNPNLSRLKDQPELSCARPAIASFAARGIRPVGVSSAQYP